LEKLSKSLEFELGALSISGSKIFANLTSH
jgi:hypothetical protein